MLYDNYRVRRYKDETMWDRVERHEARKKRQKEAE